MKRRLLYALCIFTMALASCAPALTAKTATATPKLSTPALVLLPDTATPKPATSTPAPTSTVDPKSRCTEVTASPYDYTNRTWYMVYGYDQAGQTIYTFDSSFDILHPDHDYVIEMISLDAPDRVTIEFLPKLEIKFYAATLWDCGVGHFPTPAERQALLDSFKYIQ